MFRNLRDLIFRNPGPKLVCLLIATGLWFWVTIQQTGEATFEVPIDYVNVPEDIIVADQSARIMHLTLRGPKTTLLGTDAADISASLDLEGERAGEKAFWSRDLTLDFPAGLRLVNVRPRRFQVVLRERVERVVGVKPTVGTQPPEGYDYRISVTPDTAEVYGSRLGVEQLEGLRLEPLELQDRTSDFIRDNVPARLPPNVQLSYPARNQFQVSVKIDQVEITRTVEAVPVTVVDMPAGRQGVVEPSTVDLTVEGPRQTVERLTPEDIRVKVQAPDTGVNVQIRLPDIELPDGVRLVDEDASTQTFKVRLQNP